jgi:hypothetical protein
MLISVNRPINWQVDILIIWNEIKTRGWTYVYVIWMWIDWCENTNIGVPMFMFDIRMINMSSECEYD